MPLQFETPFDFIADPRDGKSLFTGYLYFGEPFKDPESYPINVYYITSSGSTVAATQPISVVNSYAVYNGSPVRLLIMSDADADADIYSLRIKDSVGVSIFEASNVGVIDNSVNLVVETNSLTKCFASGLLNSGEVLLQEVFNREVTLSAGLADSEAYALTGATASTVISIQKNSVEVGTITFGIGSQTGVFSFASDVTFNDTDRLQLVNQDPRDATLADLSVTIEGSAFINYYNIVIGDMLKTTYDADLDGIVDAAESVDGVATAGNSKYYGTDGTGTAGFYDLPGGGGAFHGALVIESGVTGISSVGGYLVNFDTESYDTDGFADLVTSPTRLTLAAGTTKFQVSACLNHSNLGSSLGKELQIKHYNSSDVLQDTYSNGCSNSSTNTGISVQTPVIPYSGASGDYVTLTLLGSDSSLDIDKAWMSIEYKDGTL